MLNFIKVGKEKSAIKNLEQIKNDKKRIQDIRIINNHITRLNKVIGKKVFKKDALYISSETLWEIMQPLGWKGKHNYHNLTPIDIYNALRTLKDSKDISVSYDNRYVIVTLATIYDDASLVVIVSPNCLLNIYPGTEVTKVITIYPMKKKKWEPSRRFCATL